MKYRFLRIFLTIVAITAFSCSDGEDGEDGMDGVNGLNSGQEFLVISGDVTDEEAAEIIEETYGKNTSSILIINTTNLTTLVLPEIETLVRLEIKNNQNLQNLEIPSLKGVTDEVNISNNAALTSVNIENLIGLEELTVENNILLTSVNMSKLTVAEDINIEQNPLIQNIELPSLKIVNDRLIIEKIESLSTLNLNNLETIDRLSIEDNEQLTSINVQNLTVANNIRIGNVGLESFEAPELIESENDIAFGSNSNLTTVLLPKLTTVGEIRFTRNELLSTINISELASIRERISLSDNTNLETVSFPNVSSMTNVNIRINDNNSLTSISFPSLVSIIKENRSVIIIIEDNDMLTSVDFSNLESFDANSFSIDADALDTVNFDSLTTFSILRVVSSSTLSATKLSSIQDFDQLSLETISTADMDLLLAQLVRITPAITGKNVRLRGAASAQALTDAQTLRDNGNLVTISNPR